jgi:hypothetical protein
MSMWKPETQLAGATRVRCEFSQGALHTGTPPDVERCNDSYSSQAQRELFGWNVLTMFFASLDLRDVACC